MRKELFIDIETTGLDYKVDLITQLAGIVKINGVIKRKFNITSNFYNNLMDNLHDFIDRYNPDDKFYLVGYNSNFDMSFIRELFKKNDNNFFGAYFYSIDVDIMRIAAWKFMLKGMKPDNYKLTTVAKFLKIKVNESKLHDAKYDIYLTNEIYKKLLKL